jgi:ribonuclease H / adenosylcobalamin/alpha-ribazole phosphatase
VSGPSSGVSSVVSSVVVEADGGSRGNPGPAAYGAVLRDAATGAVIAEDGSTIGVASNNVAEYSGLVAGLRLAAEFAPGASIEVRMDSKLVVEQMSGRWQIKHPDMRTLAAEAKALAPAGTSYSWIPRAQNADADRLVNEALDGVASGVRSAAADSAVEEAEAPARGWSAATGAPTTLVLVRHGVTPHTVDKRFSGGLASANPGLSDEGRDQVRATAQWLSPIAERVGLVVASPVRRTAESAAIVGEVLGKQVVEEPGFAEMEFGHWDGLTFAEVAERHGPEMKGWLGSLDVAPSGGESFRTVEARVLEGLSRTLASYAGQTVVVVSHVTPIKTLVAQALGAPLSAVFAMELMPASVSVVAHYPDGKSSLRLYNARPPENDTFADPARW